MSYSRYKRKRCWEVTVQRAERRKKDGNAAFFSVCVSTHVHAKSSWGGVPNRGTAWRAAKSDDPTASRTRTMQPKISWPNKT